MNNGIQTVEVRHYRLDPAEAELRITVIPEQPAEGLEIRGRLMGPRCAYSNTIEVAYPLRPLVRGGEAPVGLVKRVLIPEPSFWEPSCPFLYEGPLELLQGNDRLAQWQLSHGLRTFKMRPRGLLLNGNPFVLNGVVRDHLDAPDAAALRQAGVDAVLTVLSESFDLWDQSDRLGFLVVARVGSTNEELLAAAARQLNGRASHLAWLLPQDLLAKKQSWQIALSLLQAAGRPFIGVELTRVPFGPLPAQRLGSDGPLCGCF